MVKIKDLAVDIEDVAQIVADVCYRRSGNRQEGVLFDDHAEKLRRAAVSFDMEAARPKLEGLSKEQFFYYLALAESEGIFWDTYAINIKRTKADTGGWWITITGERRKRTLEEYEEEMKVFFGNMGYDIYSQDDWEKIKSFGEDDFSIEAREMVYEKIFEKNKDDDVGQYDIQAIAYRVFELIESPLKQAIAQAIEEHLK